MLPAHFPTWPSCSPSLYSFGRLCGVDVLRPVAFALGGKAGCALFRVPFPVFFRRLSLLVTRRCRFSFGMLS